MGFRIVPWIALAAAACTGSKPAVEPPGERLRGHLVIGHEVRAFTPCEGGVERWVFDRTQGDLQRVHEALTVEPYEKLFVELRGRLGPAPSDGFGIDYEGSVEVLELRRAAIETRGCKEDLRGFVFIARGNEPFWNVEVRPGELRFSELGSPEPLVLAHGPIEREGALHRYASRNGGRALELDLTEARCVDTMSGEHFPFLAEVRLDGRVLKGCALEGALAP